MDKDRQIRMLVPPFFLIASVLWGAYLTGNLNALVHGVAGDEAASVRSVLAVLAVGAATLPAGYAIGAVTIFTLRELLGWLFPLRNYEIPISPQAMKQIREKLRAPASVTFDLCAAATFDHVELQPKIHEWLFRRWSLVQYFRAMRHSPSAVDSGWPCVWHTLLRMGHVEVVDCGRRPLHGSKQERDGVVERVPNDVRFCRCRTRNLASSAQGHLNHPSRVGRETVSSGGRTPDLFQIFK